MKDRLLRWFLHIVLVLMVAPVGLLWWLGHPAHPGHEHELALILTGDTFDAMLAGLAWVYSAGIAGLFRRK